MIQSSITPIRKRSTEAMRNRRKRYADRKRKSLVQERQLEYTEESATIQPKIENSGYSRHFDSVEFVESSVCESLCTRWRKRRQIFERTKQEEEAILKEAEEVQSQEMKINKSARQAKQSFQKSVNELYQEKEKESKSLSSNILLLPTVSGFDDFEDNKKLQKLGISGIQRAGVQRILQSITFEKNKALNDARTFRNMAENMKKQHRKDMAEMNEKVELVRDFWRNKLCEGSSRSGQMVKLALRMF